MRLREREREGERQKQRENIKKESEAGEEANEVREAEQNVHLAYSLKQTYLSYSTYYKVS